MTASRFFKSASFAHLILFVAIAAVGEEPAPARFEYTKPQMGTTGRIVLYAPDNKTADTAADAAFARIEALNRIFSDYLSESELSKLCAASGGPAVPVSAEMFELLSKSIDAAKLSEGAFDVTLGPQIKLWRLSRAQKTLPLPERLTAARERSGIQLLQLDGEKKTARLEKPEMRIDLGGIAKGYAADAALAVLKEKGCSRALIGLGGDIRVGDAPPGEKGWRIAIASLEDIEKKPAVYLSLANAAVSTAGDTEQFTLIDGVRYAHIIDPKTGLGMHCRRGVTVVAPTGVDSDWMDTAVYVMGLERGFKMIESIPGAAALFVEKTDAGIQRTESQRWKNLPKAKPSAK